MAGTCWDISLWTKRWLSVNRACYRSAQHAKVLAWSSLSLLSRVGLLKVFCLCKSITRKSSFLCERVYLCVWVSGQWHSGEKHKQQLAPNVPDVPSSPTQIQNLPHSHLILPKVFVAYQWYLANSMFFSGWPQPALNNMVNVVWHVLHYGLYASVMALVDSWR